VPVRSAVYRHVGEVVLDFPPVNALDSRAWRELARVVAELGVRAEVRCLLLRGEGRGFCAGADSRETRTALDGAVRAALKALRDCEVPVVTAVHSFVMGGGVGICGASDVVLAAEDAYFVVPALEHGALRGAEQVAALFPPRKARAAFFIGGRITAAEAQRLGAVERLVSPKKLIKEARAFAGLIAAKERRALTRAKAALRTTVPVGEDA
jgi:enoyl-CoA hydratase